jgi:hypothetical protein
MAGPLMLPEISSTMRIVALRLVTRNWSIIAAEAFASGNSSGGTSLSRIAGSVPFARFSEPSMAIDWSSGLR